MPKFFSSSFNNMTQYAEQDLSKKLSFREETTTAWKGSLGPIRYKLKSYLPFRWPTSTDQHMWDVQSTDKSMKEYTCSTRRTPRRKVQVHTCIRLCRARPVMMSTGATYSRSQKQHPQDFGNTRRHFSNKYARQDGATGWKRSISPDLTSSRQTHQDKGANTRNL